MPKPVVLAPFSKQAKQDEKDVLSPTLVAKTSQLTANELKLWLNYIERQVGFILPVSQNNWVKSTIKRYLYCYQTTTTTLLAKLSHDSFLYHQLFDDILIPRTQFFRHLLTFKFIKSR